MAWWHAASKGMLSRSGLPNRWVRATKTAIGCLRPRRQIERKKERVHLGRGLRGRLGKTADMLLRTKKAYMLLTAAPPSLTIHQVIQDLGLVESIQQACTKASIARLMECGPRACEHARLNNARDCKRARPLHVLMTETVF